MEFCLPGLWIGAPQRVTCAPIVWARVRVSVYLCVVKLLNKVQQQLRIIPRKWVPGPSTAIKAGYWPHQVAWARRRPLGHSLSLIRGLAISSSRAHHLAVGPNLVRTRPYDVFSGSNRFGLPIYTQIWRSVSALKPSASGPMDGRRLEPGSLLVLISRARPEREQYAEPARRWLARAPEVINVRPTS